jgi:hypothetical protein
MRQIGSFEIRFDLSLIDFSVDNLSDNQLMLILVFKISSKSNGRQKNLYKINSIYFNIIYLDRERTEQIDIEKPSSVSTFR